MQPTPARVRDPLAAVLLVLILLTSSQRLYATNWASGLGTALLLTVLGAVAGLALGLGRFNRLGAFLLGLASTLVFVPLVTIWNLYKGIAWLQRLAILSSQLAESSRQLVTGQSVNDSTLFIVFASTAFWIISLTAGFTLARSGGFAGAVLPAGVVLIVVQLFDLRVADRVLTLAVYSFLCLLLLGRLTFLRKRQFWKDRHVWVSAESVTDLNLFFGVAALALVTLVWVAPASGHPLTSARVAWEDLTRPWRDRQEQLNKTVESLQSDQVQTVDFYTDTLALGGQAETGSDAFMNIRVPLNYGRDRYYWRVRTYDLYRDGQWYTNYAFDELFTPNESALSLAEAQGIAGEFVFSSPNDNLGMLVTPARTIWLNRVSTMTFMPVPGGKIDPLMFQANPPVLAGEEYLVHANLYQPTVAQLRDAGAAYPAWVTDHYLQLPTDLSQRVTDLARQVAAGASTPYDKAVAITDYLRNNITYSPTVTSPPAGTDPLVWFLFDTRMGFCNYYATAEVILLRTLGIPARMVVGFDQGSYLPPNQYILHPSDAHAWPEVYFPGVGWVEFEPTTSQPPLVRPAGNGAEAGTPTPQTTPQANAARQTVVPLGEGGTPPGSGAPPNTLLRLTIVFLSVFALIGAILAAYLFGALDKALDSLRRTFRGPFPVFLKTSLEDLSLTPPAWLVRWATLVGLDPAQRSFAVVYRSLRWLGLESSPANTPAEAVATLSESVPQAAGPLRTLLQALEQTMFSPKPADLLAARRAAEIVRRIALRAAIRRRWEAFGGIFKAGGPHKDIHDRRATSISSR
ncbi:MAG TPA: transglutaminase-like domain-containing protein [Anaerolineales bacterium]|nr:transglutaminase-like domain-containing protein [Anaerolineales bacterium]